MNPSVSVDLQAEGFRRGFLEVPAGTDRAETLRLPLLVSNRGPGPQVLVTGTCHGDEFEGPITASRMIDWLETEHVAGRIIVLPVLNPPALDAYARNSPVDGRNLNRTYPGKPDGTLTERIAHAVTSLLVPGVDYLFDLHAGGLATTIAPSATIHHLDDADLMRRTLATAQSFRLPVTAIWSEPDVVGMLDTFAENAGKVFICLELGGGGTASVETLAATDQGLRNALIALGAIGGETRQTTWQGTSASVTIDTPAPEFYMNAPVDGLFAPAIALLQQVRRGDLVGTLYPADPWSAPPAEIRSPVDGTVYALRTKTLTRRGDNLAIAGNIISA